MHADARAAAGARRPRLRPADAVVAVAVAGIGYASLARYGWIDCSAFGATLLRESSRVSGSDLLGNVFAYLLLGAALGFAWLGRWPGRRPALGPALVAGAVATLAGALLSLSMEAAQACLPGRTSTWHDLLANTAGTALGWLGARLAHPVWSAMLRGRPGRRHEGRLAAVVAVALLAWAIAETAPWVPAGGAAVIRQNLKAAWVALGGEPLDPWRIAGRGGEWLAVGLALALPLRRPGLAVIPFCALAATAVAWRLLLPIGDAPSAATLATLPVAVPLVLTVPLLGRRACAAVALAGAIVAMLAAQLEPAYGPTQAFRWRIAVLAGDPIVGIRIAAGFVWFASTVVAAGHALDGRTARWAALAVGLLAATEWAQTALPGRTPDLSPVAIGLVAAAFAAAVLAGGGGGRTTRD